MLLAGVDGASTNAAARPRAGRAGGLPTETVYGLRPAPTMTRSWPSSRQRAARATTLIVHVPTPCAAPFAAGAPAMPPPPDGRLLAWAADRHRAAAPVWPRRRRRGQNSLGSAAPAHAVADAVLAAAAALGVRGVAAAPTASGGSARRWPSMWSMSSAPASCWCWTAAPATWASVDHRGLQRPACRCCCARPDRTQPHRGGAGPALAPPGDAGARPGTLAATTRRVPRSVFTGGHAEQRRCRSP